MMNFTSRYFTEAVAKIKPRAKLKNKAYNNTRGMSRMAGEGRPFMIKKARKNNTNAIRKSTRHTKSPDSGNNNLGKYTLVRMFALLSKALLVSLILVEINCQMTTPADTIRN